jgi:hypothetical protein
MIWSVINRSFAKPSLRSSVDLPSVTVTISVSIQESDGRVKYKIQLTGIENLFVEKGDMVEATKLKLESVSQKAFCK